MWSVRKPQRVCRLMSLPLPGHRHLTCIKSVGLQLVSVPHSPNLVSRGVFREDSFRITNWECQPFALLTFPLVRSPPSVPASGPGSCSPCQPCFSLLLPTCTPTFAGGHESSSPTARAVPGTCDAAGLSTFPSPGVDGVTCQQQHVRRCSARRPSHTARLVSCFLYYECGCASFHMFHIREASLHFLHERSVQRLVHVSLGLCSSFSPQF